MALSAVKLAKSNDTEKSRRCAPDRVKFKHQIDYYLFQCGGQGERDSIYVHSSFGFCEMIRFHRLIPSLLSLSTND